MALVSAYHTSSEEEHPVYHIYDDCPAGERVIKDGNKVAGKNGDLCDFCECKQRTGKFN